VIEAGRQLRHGETRVDLIAVLAMSGALALGEYLVGAVIAVMLTGGAALERYAVARAHRELKGLLARVPRVAHRRIGDEIADVDIDDVALGDVLVVKPGEVLPADGMVMSPSGVLDESALTGETKPSRVERGGPVRSGTTNAGGPLELRVTAPPAESTYAAIIGLVRAAETSKAPFVRLADRYALWFLGLTVAIAAGAGLVAGDPLRALAVLVVATPSASS
jgi:P-type E1-E2 ATPase